MVKNEKKTVGLKLTFSVPEISYIGIFTNKSFRNSFRKDHVTLAIDSTRITAP